MPLDTHAKRLMGMLATGVPSATSFTATRMREDFRHFMDMVGAKNIPIASTEDGELPRPGGTIAFRRYTPEGAGNRLLPACVYFHGGGGVFGSIDTHDGVCRLLANESRCQIISIDYRLAPEHRFPAGLSDCFAATEWVAKHTRELGITDAQIAVAGDSAGAGFATAVCQIAAKVGQPKISLQVLICPVLDVSRQSYTRRIFARDPFLNKATLDWMLTQLGPAGMDLKDPAISPVYGELRKTLPPAQIHTAEFDPLRSEGRIYARLLRCQGIPVQYTCHEGMPHNFCGMIGAIPTASGHLKQIASDMKKALMK